MNNRPKFGKLTASLFMVGLLALGCKSASMSYYVSPKVAGRVLDAETHQPLAEVEVRRISSDADYRVTQPPKGGQLMETAPAVRTEADGTFVIESVKNFALLQNHSWYSVNLSFRREGYDRLRVTYSLSDATNSVTGEPLVNGGNILLVPVKP